MSERRNNPVKEFFEILLRIIFVYLPGWIFLFPLSLIVPKKEGLVVFIGRDNGKFLDNVKYLFIYAFKEKGAEIKFLTEDVRTYKLLKIYNFPVIFHPSFISFLTLLRTPLVVVDNRDWIRKYKVYLLIKAIKVQLWHGVGFKKIEADNPALYRNFLIRIWNILRCRMPEYDLLVSTSSFYTENVFKNAMKYREIKEFGYPRNDVFFRQRTELDYIETDSQVIERIKKLKDLGYKVIVYTPTFRDNSENDPIKGGFINLERLRAFSQKHKFAFIVKFHPEVKFHFKEGELFPVFFYKKNKDIYPLLPESDLLVTDYSSIYMDYILMDKPVIFFPYDYETYVKIDRELQFDYNWITPGPKVYTQHELEDEIERILIKGEDDYFERRKAILNLAFKYKDGRASERIWGYIIKKFIEK